jgi:hypothetical protein
LRFEIVIETIYAIEGITERRLMPATLLVKQAIGFDGVMMSDWSATYDGVAANGAWISKCHRGSSGTVRTCFRLRKTDV